MGSSVTPQFPLPTIPDFVAADILHLILMPTEKCNFRCTYCYEDFVIGRMERPVLEGLKTLITNRATDLQRLSIEWFGGEPLLEPAIIHEVQEHVAALAARHPRLETLASMTTNGYLLTADRLRGLVERGVTAYQISVDGSAESHDLRRKRADGEGTFQRVFDNLLAARDTELEFSICVRMHVDRHNSEQIRDLLDLLATKLDGDPRFEMFIRPVSRLGGPNDLQIPVLQGDETTIVDELKKHARELGLKLRPTEPVEACYASAANSFVIRPTGEIAKCTVAFQHPNNRVGHLFPDGSARLDQNKLGGWVRGLLSGNPNQLKCPMKGFAEPEMAASPLPIIT